MFVYLNTVHCNTNDISCFEKKICVYVVMMLSSIEVQRGERRVVSCELSYSIQHAHARAYAVCLAITHNVSMSNATVSNEIDHFPLGHNTTTVLYLHCSSGREAAKKRQTF